jgi:hypothetical protein
LPSKCTPMQSKQRSNASQPEALPGPAWLLQQD